MLAAILLCAPAASGLADSTSTIAKAAHSADLAIQGAMSVPDYPVLGDIQPSCSEEYLQHLDMRIAEYREGINNVGKPMAISMSKAEKYARAFADYGEACEVGRGISGEGFMRMRVGFLDAKAVHAAHDNQDGLAGAKYKRLAIAEFRKAAADKTVGQGAQDQARVYLEQAERL